MDELKPCPFCGCLGEDLYSDHLGIIHECVGWNDRPIEDALEAERDELKAQLEAVRAAVDPESGCECVHHACDDMPCDWCYKMSDRVLAILQPDSGKDGG